MRYYSKNDRQEVFEAASDTLTNKDIPWYFMELQEGKELSYEQDGTPKLINKVVIPVDEIEEKRIKLKQELDAIVGDLSPAESMYLMLQYGFAKMNATSDASDEQISLTPTGEDIITWGDRIASELGSKLIEIKNLK